jgi:hypothetical protein
MESTLPRDIPRLGESPVLKMPIQSEGPADFFPPVCLKTHWDPTKILSRTLPDRYVPQPTDPRPWTRICMEYVTAGDQEPAPQVGSQVVMPSGGQFYPPTRYANSIDSESELRRLDRPLGTCESKQWKPTASSDMFQARVLVPDRKTVMPLRVEEIAFPSALLRAGPYECRAEQDRVNQALSSDYRFNNATKQDKYKRMGKPVRPAAAQQELQASTQKDLRQQLRPDLDFSTSGSTIDQNRVYREIVAEKGSTGELVVKENPNRPRAQKRDPNSFR